MSNTLTFVQSGILQNSVARGDEGEVFCFIHETVLVEESVISDGGSKPSRREYALRSIFPEDTQRFRAVRYRADNERRTEHIVERQGKLQRNNGRGTALQY